MTTSTVARPVAEEPAVQRPVADPAYTQPASSEPGQPESGYGRRTRGGRIHLATIGLIAALASAWGGIVPFVGPTFGYSADGSSSWEWNLPHAMLALLPGAVGVCLGLFVMARSRSVDVGRGRFTLSMAGMIMILCGAWFALGPWVWPVLSSSSHYFVPASGLRLLEYVLGYSVGTGVIIAACGGYIDGWASRFDRRALRRSAATAPVVAERETRVARDDAAGSRDDAAGSQDDAAGYGRQGTGAELDAPVMREGVGRNEAGPATYASMIGRERVSGDVPTENEEFAEENTAVGDQHGTTRSGV
jgi:hypothetical protein